MANEEKKPTDTKPEPTPEETAKKLREKDDLRTFGIAIMAAIVVVAGYHMTRQLVRVFVRNSRPPMVKQLDGGDVKPRRGGCPCCQMMHAPGKKGAPGMKQHRRGPRPGFRPGPKGAPGKTEVKKTEAKPTATEAKKPEVKPTATEAKKTEAKPAATK